MGEVSTKRLPGDLVEFLLSSGGGVQGFDDAVQRLRVGCGRGRGRSSGVLSRVSGGISSGVCYRGFGCLRGILLVSYGENWQPTQ